MNTRISNGDDPSALLDRVPAGEAADLARLRARLADDADRADALDVAYTVIDSRLGPLLLAATRRGLARVAFAIEDHEAVLDRLGAALSPRVLRAPHRLDDAARQLDEYLAGRRIRFDLPLDRALSTGFRAEVQRALPRIGYGERMSYAAVAALVGSPRAVRAVGSACATNPLPIVVPCHRVVRSDGSTGQYIGGPDVKRGLLEFEARPTGA